MKKKCRSIEKEKLKNIFLNIINKSSYDNLSKKDLIRKIITNGAKGAFTARTVTGIGKLGKKNGQTFDEVLEKFAEELIVHLKGIEKIKNQNEFDKKHKALCDLFLEKFENKDCNKKNKIILQFGKAQKVVNIFFKYLYCLYGGKKFNNVYEYCHMPLDSYILNWVRYVVCDEIEDSKEIKKVINDISWSNLDYEQYIEIQKIIRVFLEKQNEWPKIPFYAEFYIWPEEQLFESLYGLSYSKYNFLFDGKDKDNIVKLNDAINNIINSERIKCYVGSRNSKENVSE